ncbi:hypothetical protein QJS10_CPB13g00911 [Acorus calamus]|uniref:Dirigent protein n=1 Tax=Acorus calamus TaxID=4465 RepID=A0AAV9DI22_ACOCL|nr:hypothetical protein QJS10_CPB13g00911 [Acorus calamus]
MSNPIPLLLLLLTLLPLSLAAKPPTPFPHPLRRLEKQTHLRFFWHDIVSGRNPTAIRVAAAPTTNASSTGFGAVVMIDDPLTESPQIDSKLVGRAQGLYALSAQEEVGLLMAMNFAFLNGSTLTVMGRNKVFDKVREMPVIGGSGAFRFARGYVEARTHTYDQKTGDACVEYNVFVLHH